MSNQRTRGLTQMFLALGLLFLMRLNAFAQSPTLITYPAIPGLTTSQNLTVKVNGTSVWTELVGGEGTEGLQVANFSCAGPQTVTIEASANISSFVIRPKALGITGKISGKTLTFTIPGPQKLYVEIDHLP